MPQGFAGAGMMQQSVQVQPQPRYVSVSSPGLTPPSHLRKFSDSQQPLQQQTQAGGLQHLQMHALSSPPSSSAGAGGAGYLSVPSLAMDPFAALQPQAPQQQTPSPSASPAPGPLLQAAGGGGGGAGGGGVSSAAGAGHKQGGGNVVSGLDSLPAPSRSAALPLSCSC